MRRVFSFGRHPQQEQTTTAASSGAHSEVAVQTIEEVTSEADSCSSHGCREQATTAGSCSEANDHDDEYDERDFEIEWELLRAWEEEQRIMGLIHREDQKLYGDPEHYSGPKPDSGEPPWQVQQQSGSSPSWRRPSDGVDVHIPEGFYTMRVREQRCDGSVCQKIVDTLKYTLSTVKRNILSPEFDLQLSFLAVVSPYDREIVMEAWDYFCKWKFHRRPIRVRWIECSSDEYTGSGASWKLPSGVDVRIPEGFYIMRVKERFEGDVRHFIVDALDFTFSAVKQNILSPWFDLQSSFLAVVSPFDRNVVMEAWGYFCKMKLRSRPIRVRWTKFSASDYTGSPRRSVAANQGTEGRAAPEEGEAPRFSSCEEATAHMLGRDVPAPGTDPEPFHTASPLQPVTCGWEKLEIYGYQTRWKHAVFKERNTCRPTASLMEPDAKTTRMLLEDRVQRQTPRDPCRAEIQFMRRFILNDAVPESTDPKELAHAKKTVVVLAGEEPLTGENVYRLDVCLNALIVDMIPFQSGKRKPLLALVDTTMYIDVSDDENNRSDANDKHTFSLPSSSSGSSAHGKGSPGLSVCHEPPLHVKLQVTPLSADSASSESSANTDSHSHSLPKSTSTSKAEETMLDIGNASTGSGSPLASDAEVSAAAESSADSMLPEEALEGHTYQIVPCESYLSTPEEVLLPSYPGLDPGHLRERLNAIQNRSNDERAGGGDVPEEPDEDITRTPDPFD